MFKRIRELLAKGNPLPKGFSFASGGTNQKYFENRERNQSMLMKCQTIYQQGGIIAEALDTYPTFAIGPGWTFQGENPRQVDEVQQFYESFDAHTAFMAAIVDADVYGDAFQEIVHTKGGDLHSIVPRPSYTFKVIQGNTDLSPTGYRQTIPAAMGKENSETFEPDKILQFTARQITGYPYGQSLIQRALDDIIRDTKTAESTAAAIERHGFPKYHVRVGREGETVQEEDMAAVSKTFKDINAKNEFITPYDVLMKNIDEGGLPNVSQYNDITLTRMCAALGVPEELLGLRRGTTDATAVSRIQVFYKKVENRQKQLSRAHNLQVIDKITQEPGAVKLVFNDVSPQDEAAKAEWIVKMMEATPLDPFAVLPLEWIQERIGIEVDNS